MLFYYSAHLPGILSNTFTSSDTVCFDHRSGAICSLYRANREISKVCLQIICVCGLETGFLEWEHKNTCREMFVSKQDRVFNLIL